MLVDRLYYELNLDTKTSEAGLNRLYGGMSNVLSSIVKWGSLTGAVLAFAKAVKDAKENYLEFEEGARRVWTLLDVSEEELRSYTGALLDMSTRIPQSIGNLEKAMYDAISSNIDLGDSMDFIEQSSKGAIAGMTDVATAVDLNTTILNAYEKKVRDVADINDILFVGVDKGKVTYEEFASSLGTIIPTAAALDVELESLISAISAMTLGGISADNAVTYLNQVLVGILNPTKEARDEAEKYGVELSQTALEAKGLLPFLSDLKDAVGDNGESMAKMFGNVRALRSVLSLTGPQLDDFNRIMGEMGERAGSTEDAYSKMVDATVNKVETLSNTWKSIGILMWEKVNPAFQDVLGVLNSLGLGIKSLVDDSYKLRDMFSDLDEEAETLVLSIDDVAKKVDNANSVVQLYATELDRVNSDASDFGSSLSELTELIDEHNFAVETGEGDYIALRDSINKLVDENPELIGMYEAEGDMLKLNIELIKAEIDARIALMEVKKLELKDAMDQQNLEIDLQKDKLKKLGTALDETIARKERLEPLRQGLAELYGQIGDLRQRGVWGEEAERESQRLLKFIDEYGAALLKEGAIGSKELDYLRERLAHVQDLIGAAKEGSILPADVLNVMKQIFSMLPEEMLTNFDSELANLNKTIAESETAISKTKDELELFTKKVDSASASIKYTDLAIQAIENVKDTIGTADSYWDDWFNKQKNTFKRQIDSYKAMKDSQSKYDQEIAQQSFNSAVGTLKKIRQYAVSMGNETAAEWAAGELRALETIEAGHQETYDSIIARKKEQLDKDLALQKQHLDELKRVIGDSTDKYLLQELEREAREYENLLRRAFGETADMSYLEQLQGFTGKALDELISDIEDASNKLTTLREQEAEATNRLVRAMQFGDLDEQVSLMNQLSSISKEIAYTSTIAVEAFDAYGKSALWTARADLLKGDIDKVAQEYENLLKVLDEHTKAGRYEEATKAAQAIRSLALAQAEHLIEAGKDASEWINVYDDMGEEVKALRELLEPPDKTFFEQVRNDLADLEKRRAVMKQLYDDAVRFGESDQIKLLMNSVNDLEDEIISMLYSSFKEAGDYNIFELLIDRSKEYGRTTEAVLDFTSKSLTDNLEWEKEKLDEIAKIEEEIITLTQKGYSAEAETKLRRLQGLYLEMGLYAAGMGDLQNKYFTRFEEIQKQLNVDLKETSSIMGEFMEKKGQYFAVIKQGGETAEEAGRAIAGSIAKLFEQAYLESVAAGKANDAFWKGYEYWIKKSRKETDLTTERIQDLREELEAIDKSLEEAEGKGLWGVASKLAQDRINILSSLSKLMDGFLEDYQGAIDKKAEIDKKLEATPEELFAKKIKDLEKELSTEKAFKERANEELIDLERELREERDRQLAEGRTDEEIEASPEVISTQEKMKILSDTLEEYERKILKLNKELWELTGETEYMNAWIASAQSLVKTAETVESAWERIRQELDFMILDSERLSESYQAQFEALQELLGGPLPKAGRGTYLQELLNIDKAEALQIAKYYDTLETKAKGEIDKAIDDLNKELQRQFEDTLDRTKEAIDRILSWDYMSYEQRINWLNVLLNTFKGSEAEKIAVTQMVNEEIAKLEDKAFEERKRKIQDQSEMESEARIEGAKDAIEGIAKNEKLSIQERINSLRNHLKYAHLEADERLEIEADTNDKIKALQMELDKELERRAQEIPQAVNYKTRLDLLDQYHEEALLAVEDNETAKLKIEEKYQALWESAREAEIDRVRGRLDDVVGFVKDMTEGLGDILEEGGEGAGLRFINAFFENMEAISDKYIEKYVLNSLLDSVAEATTRVQETEGLEFGQALAQSVSAAVSGNLPELFITALTFNLSQMKKQWELAWEGLKNIQIKWLQDMLLDLEWFFGGSKEAIENMKHDIEDALMRSDSVEAFGENLEATIKDRIKQGIITAFLETAAMKALFKRIAEAMNEAMKDEEVTSEEWEAIKAMIRQAAEQAEDVFKNLPEDFFDDVPKFDKPSNAIKSITEETANVLLAVERSSNLYLKEMNENLRVVKGILQGWDGRTPPRDVGYEVQQNLRSHGL